MEERREPVGALIAEQVAGRLQQGGMLGYRHRDYCGVGLRYADGEFIYGEIHDGALPSSAEVAAWPIVPEGIERVTFQSRSEIVSWLARQTDESLNGCDQANPGLHNNQRLNLERIKAFAAGVPEPDPYFK